MTGPCIWEDTGNLFALIAFKNKWLADYWENSIENNVITLKQFLTKINTNSEESINRGTETSRGGKIQYLTIMREKKRAIKKQDMWIVSEIQDKAIVCQNRLSGKEVKIPNYCLSPAIRRLSVINSMDVTSSSDFVITGYFNEIDNYFVGAWDKKNRKFWSSWKEYVEDRLCHLAVIRRGDISAPGTTLLAIYSDSPFAPPGVAWGIKLSKGYSRLMALWFNSTLSILQVLYHRKETRGAFLQIDGYILEKISVPDFTKINNEQSSELLDLFSAVKDVKFPSLLEQLINHFPARMEIDRVFMKLLGLQGSDSMLTKLYDALAEEIILLKQLMQGETNEGDQCD